MGSINICARPSSLQFSCWVIPGSARHCAEKSSSSFFFIATTTELPPLGILIQKNTTTCTSTFTISIMRTDDRGPQIWYSYLPELTRRIQDVFTH